jgi:hypothetical protein
MGHPLAKRATAAPPVTAATIAYLTVNLHGGTLLVPVTVMETRDVYGRTDCLVRPVGGMGEAWVAESKLTNGGDGKERDNEADAG